MPLSPSEILKLSSQLSGLTPSEKEDYLLEHNIDQLRVCDECGNLMEEGFCIHGGEEHYCSEEYLHKHYSEQEYQALSADQDSDTYYTTWNE